MELKLFCPQIVYVGGLDESDSPVAFVEVFNTTTFIGFLLTGTLDTPRAFYNSKGNRISTLGNLSQLGTIFPGGVSASQPFVSTFSSGITFPFLTWDQTSPYVLTSARKEMATTSFLLEGNVTEVFFGGFNPDTLVVSDGFEIVTMDPVSPRVFSLILTPTRGATACSYSNKVYIAGGYQNAYLDTIQAVNPTVGTVTTLSSKLLAPRAYHVCATLGPYIYIAGGKTNLGFGDVTLRSVEVIDTRDGTVFPMDPFQIGVMDLVAVSTPNAVYFAGGFSLPNSTTVRSIYNYTCGNGIIENDEVCDVHVANCSQNCYSCQLGYRFCYGQCLFNGTCCKALVPPTPDFICVGLAFEANTSTSILDPALQSTFFNVYYPKTLRSEDPKNLRP